VRGCLGRGLTCVLAIPTETAAPRERRSAQQWPLAGSSAEEPTLAQTHDERKRKRREGRARMAEKIERILRGMAKHILVRRR
jgi:hypothetical protein